MRPQPWAKFMNLLHSSNVRVSVLYGMTECNGVLGCLLSDIYTKSVPMGRPFPGVRCLLINEENQVICHSNTSDEIGHIHISGKKHMHLNHD